jgi:beta-glucosidase
MKHDKHSCAFVKRRDFLVLATAGAASALTGWAFVKNAGGSVLAAQSGQAPALDTGAIAMEYFEKARQRAAAMVAKLTLEEKVSQLGNSAPAIPRVGLPAFQYWNEALHGLIHKGPITSFPLPLAMGCTWNPSLIQQVYAVVSDEIWAWHKRDKQCLTMFSPVTVNMGTRDPRWGRIGENYSEDPHLVSQMAIYTIHGMQGQNPRYLKTIVCAKHFTANDTESDREETSATVDPRSYWEYYSRGFEACVRRGHVFTVMSSYNEMNGIPTSASRFLLTDLLRGRWGFRGYVVSDCDAIGDIFRTHHFVKDYAEASALAVNAGADINCGDTLPKYLGAAVDQMLVSEEAVDEALTRALTGRVLLGEFDPPEQNPYSSIPIECLESAEHQQFAREAARQSIVLFKNQNNTLPLAKRQVKKLAVIGPMAELCELGDYSGLPDVRISPLQGIREYFGIFREPSYHLRASEISHLEGDPNLYHLDEGGQYLGYAVNGSWASFPKMLFDGATEFRACVASGSAGGKMDVHIDNLDGPLVASLKVENTGDWLKWVNVSAPLASPVSGEHTVYLRFYGASGELFNVKFIELAPAKPSEIQPAPVKISYARGCSVLGEKEPEKFDEAVKIAREADAALVFVGASLQVSSEGQDRQTIDLPGFQHELIKAVFAANPRTILVISSNCPVAVSWEQEHLPAIVGGHFLGQQQGYALVDVLFGDYNPGGKLNTTWYKSVDDLPDFHDYNIRKGRTYMYFRGIPLYPFGHGLSYTSFKYSGIQISSDTLKPGGKVTVTFELTNTGHRDGDEVVQLYVRFPETKVERPVKQLANFERVHLKAAETKKVNLDLPYEHDALRYWDEAKHQFVVEPGTLELLIGASSADIRLTEEVQLSVLEQV